LLLLSQPFLLSPGRVPEGPQEAHPEGHSTGKGQLQFVYSRNSLHVHAFDMSSMLNGINFVQYPECMCAGVSDSENVEKGTSKLWKKCF